MNENGADEAGPREGKPEPGGDKGAAKRPSFRGAFMDMEVDAVITMRMCTRPQCTEASYVRLAFCAHC